MRHKSNVFAYLAYLQSLAFARSPGCLIGMYVVLRHRAWFLELTHNVYENRPLIALAEQTKKKRIKAFLMEKWWNISI
jgi:hypothetical protein